MPEYLTQEEAFNKCKVEGRFIEQKNLIYFAV